MRRGPSRASQRGFTLLELLIAMSILAIVAAIAAHALGSMATSQTVNERTSERLARTQMTTMLLSRDINQIVNRSVRDAFGEAMPALSFEQQPNGAQLRIVRAGVTTGRTASRLQRVGWHLRDGELYRGQWNFLDGIEPQPHRERSMLHQAADDPIREWQIRFYYQDGDEALNQTTVWPPANEPSLQFTLPSAIEMTLTFEQSGVVELFYALPQ